MDTLSHFSFQPVFCNKGCGIYYPVCWIKHIIRKSSPSSGGSGFYLILYLSALFNKIFPIFLHRFLTFTNQSNDYNDILKCIYVLCLLVLYRKAHFKNKFLAYNWWGGDLLFPMTKCLTFNNWSLLGVINKAILFTLNVDMSIHLYWKQRKCFKSSMSQSAWDSPQT